ncbi:MULTISPECIES: acetyl-CoA C-acetyltransferase [Paenibacillus]|jgi:acetyl-CoA C-acetyltransferase|uniref:acetyl-CoA C-acetyltransferase n=1 Tax=Paenibacillus TaxID=44249 RepID=UPI0002E57E63|nr:MULTISPECIES: acetyl-CoA C-acetyltransferase [Paenibacillus]KAE8560159.1 acetyl-CoA acetyltransferase [Paenibacillus polymyxa]KAF6618323.1 acetyl-CoA C-acetyltransferase [Paenibacillus sp. EKM101P]KAF6624669.1 acetyl-CoA C-acetyltransferase [Paenibacillus sp. EKM102P]KAF6635552.1 acetyl-CoA C-acetyltransferase [Paenibacillus sp. EKM10P]KAF6648739.1 acetyl-CoA C-acetyltransferase [Paenibacillus sp. EKM11P]
MKKVAIVSPLRTAVGSFNKALAPLSAPELGATVMTACLQQSKLEPSLIDQIFMGNVLQAGNGQNPARQAALKAGIPIDVPESTINTVCGSGLHAVALAYDSILAEQGNIVLAGGMESMSNAPYLLKNARNGYKLGNGELVDSLVADGLTCPINHYHMGITAENVAEKYGISRLEQDAFAYESQIKAVEAKNNKVFEEQIVPVMIKNKKETTYFTEDEHIRGNTTKEKLSQLKPAFKENGTVTAGNASGINDGAAAMLVVSEDKCKEHALKPLAYIKGYSLVGVDPAYMGMGPVKAISSLLKKQGMSIDDIDLFEINEAFAAQALAVQKELGVNPEKVNVNGGAIAIGHPVGASGARVLVTLVHEMVRRSSRYGVVSLCIGTGMGIAMLVENALI